MLSASVVAACVLYVPCAAAVDVAVCRQSRGRSSKASQDGLWLHHLLAASTINSCRRAIALVAPHAEVEGASVQSHCLCPD